jgi:hypothetical protein
MEATEVGEGGLRGRQQPFRQENALDGAAPRATTAADRQRKYERLKIRMLRVHAPVHDM